MKYSILLADDDASIRFVLSKSLTKSGFNVRATDNAQTLLKWVKNGDGDVILTDVHMDADDIFTFIPEITKLRPELPIVIMSANTSVATALKSGNAGVFEYIPKPFDLNNLEYIIRRALEKKIKENKTRPIRIERSVADPIIGKSIAMQPVFRGISDYMSADIPVFIYGDVGTGKDHVAKLLHASGSRSKQPFLFFDDYTSIDTLESAAEGGVLYVDRVNELPISKQTLLLRVLEKNEQRGKEAAFRVVSSANITAQEILGSGCVRADLFYRLKGGEISLPSLNKRSEDIEELAAHFLNLSGKPNQRSMSKKALNTLKSYHWAGNVRELKGLMQLLALKFSDVVISDSVLKSVLIESSSNIDISSHDALVFNDLRTASIDLLRNAETSELTPYVQALAWVEKPLIEEALRITGGNNLRAAALLGIHRNTLRTKIKVLGILVD